MLHHELEKHLREKILPFWENLRDEKNGGFYGYVDKELNVHPEEDKGCILNSRILWTFSTAGRILKDETSIALADMEYDYLKTFEDKENGGVFWSVTYDGKPADTTKHTYCQAFAIYGLAAYYRLTGKKEALEKAMQLFDIIEKRCTVYNGYGEAYKADFSPESNEKLSENGVMATRTMNTLMHVLEAYAELYRAGGNAMVKEAGLKCLDRFLNVMYSPEKRRLGVFFDDEYQELLDMQSYGHDIEASWLLWDAVETLVPESGREPYKAMCIELARSVYERAWTDHGLKNECVDGIDEETRVWWVQAETLLGFANAGRLTGEKIWEEKAAEQWETIRRMIVDPREKGEWYWSVNEDGTMTWRPMVEQWKCPYHNSRMCLQMITWNL